MNFIWHAHTLRGAVIVSLLSILAWVVWRLIPYVGQAFVTWVKGKARVAEIKAAGEAEVNKIRETGEVLRSLAELGPEQAERLQGRLERVRPPPGQVEPPATS